MSGRWEERVEQLLQVTMRQGRQLGLLPERGQLGPKLHKGAWKGTMPAEGLASYKDAKDQRTQNQVAS